LPGELRRLLLADQLRENNRDSLAQLAADKVLLYFLGSYSQFADGQILALPFDGWVVVRLACVT
jgi:hypothetical protein